VTLSVEACPLEIDLDFAIPLGLLVTELVTNSIKHAFPGGVGNISVTLRPDIEGKLVLIVSDDGQGQADIDIDNQSKGGLGKGIIRSLVSQLKGTLIVRNENGTTSEIRTAIPVPPA
jgi:two-component sensor histidine kinase